MCHQEQRLSLSLFCLLFFICEVEMVGPMLLNCLRYQTIRAKCFGVWEQAWLWFLPSLAEAVGCDGWQVPINNWPGNADSSVSTRPLGHDFRGISRPTVKEAPSQKEPSPFFMNCCWACGMFQVQSQTECWMTVYGEIPVLYWRFWSTWIYFCISLSRTTRH